MEKQAFQHPLVFLIADVNYGNGIIIFAVHLNEAGLKAEIQSLIFSGQKHTFFISPLAVEAFKDSQQRPADLTLFGSAAAEL